MGALSTPAIVLRAINYGEADRVVTLFGRNTGRLSALARGARKSQKRFAGGLGLCAIGEASLRERNGAELLTLETFELRQPYPSFSTDLGRMAHAAYAAELVSKLVAPRQVEPPVYDWLEAFLAALDAQGASAERLRVYELGLLGRLGFGPVVGTCAVCAGARVTGPAAEAPMRWDAERGGAVCTSCGRHGRPIRPVVRAAMVRFVATALPEAADIRLPADVNQGCREALQEVIKLHITGTLQSLEFMTKLASASAKASAKPNPRSGDPP